MTRDRLPIRPTRAVGILGLVAILSIVLSVSLLLYNLRSQVLEHERIETVSLTKVYLRQTEQNIENIDLVLRGVQERLQNPYGSQLELNSLATHLLLNTRISGAHHITSLFVVDTEGNVAGTSRDFPNPKVSVADRAYFKWFTGGNDQGLYIDRPSRGRREGGWAWHLARVLRGKDGEFRGVVVAAVNVSQFEELFKFVKLEMERPMSIYMSDGTLVASLPHREAQIGDKAPELGSDDLSVSGEEVRMLTHARGDGGRQGFSLGKSSRFPILTSVTSDEETALYAWRETAWPIVAGSILVCVFIIAATGVLINEIVREQELTSELTGAHDRYHQTIDSVMDGIVAIDASHRIVVFNPAAERMFGRSAREALGLPLEELMPQRARPAHSQHVDQFTSSGQTSKAMGAQLDVMGRRADGTEFPIESTISQTMIGGQRQLTAVLRDVTERRRNEDNLRAVNAQLRKLSESLQTVREEERSRISRELHDELGQQLTGLKLEFSWLGNRLREGREVSRDEINAMRHSIDKAISSVRRISTELRPLILDELGFAEAIAWQVEEFGKRTGVETKMELTYAPHITDGALASGLFRIVQESLTNIARHAEATQAGVCIVGDSETMTLTVQDNGKGIADGARRGGGGIGLVSMRERAIALGATFDIQSNPGEGCTIVVTLPLPTSGISGEAA